MSKLNPSINEFTVPLATPLIKKPCSQLANKVFGDPAGIRTQDPYIKSVLLYQLSYRIIFPWPTTIFRKGWQKYGTGC